MNDSNFLVIPSWVRKLDLANLTEAAVFSLIYGFSQDGTCHFSGSRKYIAEMCMCSLRTVDTTLISLIEKGYVTKKTEDINRVKFCYYSANLEKIGVIIARGSEQIAPPVQKLRTPRANSAHNNIEDNIINNNINNACARTREENSDVENSELQQYAEKLKADVPRCEKECMENHLANLDTLNCYIDRFNTELYLSGRAPHCFSDYRSHFHNWLRIQVDRETKEVNNLKSSEYGTNKQNYRKSNDRPEGWLEAAVEWGIATAKQQRAELAERNR